MEHHCLLALVIEQLDLVEVENLQVVNDVMVLFLQTEPYLINTYLKYLEYNTLQIQIIFMTQQ